LTDATIGNHDSVFVTQTFKGGVGYQKILTKSQFTIFRSRTVDDDITLFKFVSKGDQRMLVVTGVLRRVVVFAEIISDDVFVKFDKAIVVRGYFSDGLGRVFD